MTSQERKDDLFLIQVRLFRMAQQKWNLSASECDDMFREYAINDYIAICYEEFHTQGDEAMMSVVVC